MVRPPARLTKAEPRGGSRGGWLGTALLLAALAASGAGCSVDSATNHYILAERLWADGKYQAAVAEFDRVAKRDPKGKLGMQALLRSANTEAIFLKNYPGAIAKFRRYTKVSENSSEILAIERQIGEILFTQLEEYKEAIQQYESLMRLDPGPEERPKYLYRMGKSHFFLWRFQEAISVFQRIQKEYSRTVWAERAAFEVGLTYFTSGGHRAEGDQESGEKPDARAYEKAIAAYEDFLKRFPDSELAPRARYGIASCYEELDQLEIAYNKYQELEKTYPSPSVIQIKLARIRERRERREQLDQRGRTL